MHNTLQPAYVIRISHRNATNVLCVLYFCKLCECLQHLKYKIVIIKHIGLWEGVITNERTIDDEPERTVPAEVMDVSVAL